MDATESSYSKLQKLKGTLNENAFVDAELGSIQTQARPFVVLLFFDEQHNHYCHIFKHERKYERHDTTKKNRALVLHLTDGENRIKAAELQPIYKLQEDKLIPGTKVE